MAAEWVGALSRGEKGRKNIFLFVFLIKATDEKSKYAKIPVVALACHFNLRCGLGECSPGRRVCLGESMRGFD